MVYVSHKTCSSPPFKPELLGKVSVSGMKGLVSVSRDMHTIWYDSASMDFCVAVVSLWRVGVGVTRHAHYL